MGTHRRGRRARGGLQLSSIARVVPAIPSFSVDAGFRYSIPERLASRLDIGSLVRVPLGGRRSGGSVVAIEDGDPASLKPIASISGQTTVFDPGLLEVMRWAANHYVAPLSVMLARCAPPNNPPAPPSAVTTEPSRPDHPLVGSVAAGTHRTTLWLTTDDVAEWVRALGGEAIASDRSLVVVLPTGEEVQTLADTVGPDLGGHLAVVDHEMDDAAVTASWAHARHRPCVLIGTPRIAAWHVPRLLALAAVEESRRAMKDRQTPTVHARDLLLARAVKLGIPSLFAGAAPSLELIARGPQIRRPNRRVIPLVEVVDRRDDPPGSGLLSERARQAIQAVVRKDGSVFVFAHRRGYSAASRCVRCRNLRRCPSCGSRPDPAPTCRRCGAELGPCVECAGARFEPLGAGVGRLVDDIGRFLDRDQVGEHPTDRPVSVGTERDLTTIDDQDLVVLVDMDGLMYGVDYRAAEEAFRLAVRLATKVGAGSGRRLIVQTNDPDHAAITALRRADPEAFHRAELAERRAMGYPPYGGLLVIEARGEDAEWVDHDIRSLGGDVAVLGPAPSAGGTRWLVQGEDLRRFKGGLRAVAQKMRDHGLTVRIDVDPIDL